MAGLSVDIKARASSGGREFALDAAFSASGGCVVLFGPSGSGKSMTLRCMAGLMRPDAGRIEVGGRVLFDAASGMDVPARLRRIGYLFQDYALFPHLSVSENVGFALYGWTRPRPSKGRQRMVGELLDAFELGPHADCLPRDLSGGQRQRVALARALAAGPEILLLDEPFAALDYNLRERMRGYLMEVHGRFGLPMVIVTHDPADVVAFGGTLVRYGRGLARMEGARVSPHGDGASSDYGQGRRRGMTPAAAWGA